MTDSKTKHLLSPFQSGALQVRNRIAMAPMTRARSGAARVPNALMAEYYRQRASVGLIITEATTISEQGNGWVDSPGIYTDGQRDAWKPIVETVHDAGSTIFLQLWHTGRASHSSFNGGALPVAPSAIAINGEGVHTADGKQPHEVPRALDTEELPGIVEDYRRAAERARDAGFDGVEIHAANGYLLDEFLESKTNHRTDAYGGSLENRYRLLKEVVEAVCTVLPAERVAVRLSPNGVFNDMGSPDFRETFTYVATQLDAYGLAYLHIMDGLAFGFHELGTPMTLANFRAVYSGTLMGNCGYTAEAAEAAIADGHADLIAIGRPLITNPDYVARVSHGWPLADAADPTTWSSPGAAHYTDYPEYSEA